MRSGQNSLPPLVCWLAKRVLEVAPNLLEQKAGSSAEFIAGGYLLQVIRSEAIPDDGLLLVLRDRQESLICRLPLDCVSKSWQQHPERLLGRCVTLEDCGLVWNATERALELHCRRLVCTDLQVWPIRTDIASLMNNSFLQDLSDRLARRIPPPKLDPVPLRESEACIPDAQRALLERPASWVGRAPSLVSPALLDLLSSGDSGPSSRGGWAAQVGAWDLATTALMEDELSKAQEIAERIPFVGRHFLTA